MATLAQLQDDPNEADEPQTPDGQDAAPDGPDDEGGGSADGSDDLPTDGGDPDQMIGFIDPRLPVKVRVFLRMARISMLNPTGLATLKKILMEGSDHVQSIALFVGKIIEFCQTKLGPLTDQERDQVATFITGWIVSSLQKRGMPGLDDMGARHDLIGRVLQAYSALSGENAAGNGAQDAQGAAPGPGGPPTGPGAAPPAPGGAPPPDDGGTLPQLGGP